jgi:16S rRNA G966 N2-methylase RsmD
MIGHPKPDEREEDLVAENVLYYGNNLGVLQQHVKGETVDLVYLDPPFNSNQTTYSVAPETSVMPFAAISLSGALVVPAPNAATVTWTAALLYRR